ncbi:BON domain-containing protein [Granulosicoccus sp. 3-233]|uniref:BON domain-containing protein n=1 Tax=Granulosicoccus sp. 3-233 TaxID=3417969 RepID=UPI003D354E77
MKLFIAVTLLALFVTFGNTYASHEIVQTPIQKDPVDTHISWHEFRHDLGSYPSVNATMDSSGIITLSGHTDSVYEKAQLGRLAMRVLGASDIRNMIFTD